MTPEQIEKHRKRFEELMAEKVHETQKTEAFGRYHSGSYRNGYIDGAWHGYLLCADNLEVELPEPESDGFAPSVNYHDLVDKLESQGIKVKP